MFKLIYRRSNHESCNKYDKKWDAAESLDSEAAIAAYLDDVIKSGDRDHIAMHSTPSPARAG